MSRILPLFLALIPVLSALPGDLAAQERDLVFNQLTVSSQEASLVLEFDDGSSLAASLRDGRILVDGAEVGRYAPGGNLESSWRGLLARAVSADNGQVLEILSDWSPPSDLDPEETTGASALSDALQVVTRTRPATSPPSAGTVEGLEELLQGLVLDPDYLRALTAAALERELRPARVVVDRELQIESGETLEGSVLALNSRLELDGILDGDLLLLGGGLRLGPDGRITGDLRWRDADLTGELDGIAGGAHEIEPILGISSSELSERIRSEVRSATANARNSVQRTTRSPFRGIARGMGGLFQTAVTFAIFLAVGLALLHFFPRELDVVSRTASRAPGRSFLVGVAGGVLAFPVWISGMVLLAVTVIGIPVLLLWIPAVPIVVAGLIILGYIAMSRNVGQWVSARNLQGLEGMDASRPAMQIALGLVTLLAAFAIASVLQIGGAIFSPFAVLMKVGGYLLTIGVGCIGLGAVLLSRAGREPGYGSGEWDPDPWAPTPPPAGSGRTPGAEREPVFSEKGSRPTEGTEPPRPPPGADEPRPPEDHEPRTEG